MARKKPRPLPQDLNLPPGGADSHVHLDMGELKSSLDQVLARAGACGVSTLGNVFMGPEAYEQGRKMFENHDQVFFILGIHPHEARTYTSAIASRMAECVREDQKIKAIGEIGLDFFYKHSSPEEQQHAFQEQLDLAKQLDLPVVIHSRDAYEQTMDILLDMGFRNRPLLWHCFSQGPDQAGEIMSHGWKISVPGTVTYKKNIILRQAVEAIHPGHLLLETDCPFLAPEPYRGKENEPALLGFTALEIAEIKDMDLGELWLKCGQNCRDFFHVD